MLRQFYKLSSFPNIAQRSGAVLHNVFQINKRFIQTNLEENNVESRGKNDDVPKNQLKHTNPFAKEPTQYHNDDENELKIVPLSAAEREKRLKVLQLEADIAHQEGRRVPKLEFFKDEHWEHVLTLPSPSARRRYYSYLWQIAMKREAQARKKEEKAAQTLIRKEELRKEREENDHIIYGLGHCSMFLRIYDSTIDSWQNYKLIRAMQFAPKIVLDCSYDKHMNRKEAINAAKQLTLCFAENRSHDDPFDMHYCNIDWNSTSMQALQKSIPTILNPEFPLNTHEKCFTEVFPKENIVYLTPHCRNDLESYNPDDVYVIGALVDTVHNEPLSLAKAKKLGLRMARLPLDRYMQWGSGSGKSLTLNQMVKILLDLKSTGDWEKALSNVPRRKVVDFEEHAERERHYIKKRANMLKIDVRDFLNDEDIGRNSCTKLSTPTTIRSKKEGIEFDLDSWGSKKKQKK